MVSLKSFVNTPANLSGWNADYVSVLAQRWDLNNRFKVLEIGCGRGHWSKQYIKHLPLDADITLSDISLSYLNDAQKFLMGEKRNVCFVYADVHDLPFKDETFDFITCQRVLMHINSTSMAISEIKRVLKNDGLVTMIEPYSIYRALSSCYRHALIKPKDIAQLLYFQEVVEKGKILSGNGDSSIGETIPRILTEAGFINIQTFLNDCVIQLLPKDPSPINMQLKLEINKWLKTNFYSLYNKSETERYFKLGGGSQQEYDYFVQTISMIHKKISKLITQDNAHIIINDPVYITTGVK